MCGIVGYSGLNNITDNDIKILYLSNMLRGIDSTGFIDITNKNLGKEVGNAVDFCLSFEKQLKDTKCFIGHTRSASFKLTSGDVEESHPYQYSKIAGVHNGFITNTLELIRARNINNLTINMDTDSRKFYCCLNHDLEKDANNLSILSEIEGVFALVFYIKGDTDKFYCIRNSERPLHYGKKDDNIYISSTKEPLQLINCVDIKEFESMWLYSIENGIVTKIKEFVAKVRSLFPIDRVNHFKNYKNESLFTDEYDDMTPRININGNLVQVLKPTVKTITEEIRDRKRLLDDYFITPELLIRVDKKDKIYGVCLKNIEEGLFIKESKEALINAISNSSMEDYENVIKMQEDVYDDTLSCNNSNKLENCIEISTILSKVQRDLTTLENDLVIACSNYPREAIDIIDKVRVSLDSIKNLVESQGYEAIV